jgi:hypothetical protein
MQLEMHVVLKGFLIHLLACNLQGYSHSCLRLHRKIKKSVSNVRKAKVPLPATLVISSNQFSLYRSYLVVNGRRLVESKHGSQVYRLGSILQLLICIMNVTGLLAQTLQSYFATPMLS